MYSLKKMTQKISKTYTLSFPKAAHSLEAQDQGDKGTYGLILILEYIFAIWLAITRPKFFNHSLHSGSRRSLNFPAFSSMHFEILPSGIGGGAMAEVHRVFVGSRQGVGVPCLHSTTSTTL